MIPMEQEAENEQYLHLRGGFYGGFPAVRAEKEAADEEMVKNVITLFCEENLEEMQTEETSFAG